MENSDLLTTLFGIGLEEATSWKPDLTMNIARKALMVGPKPMEPMFLLCTARRNDMKVP